MKLFFSIFSLKLTFPFLLFVTYWQKIDFNMSENHFFFWETYQDY